MTSHEQHYAELQDVAGKEVLSPERQRELTGAVWIVRKMLAARPDLHRDAALTLASDPERAVRSALALNPMLPDAASSVLLHDADREVRADLAQNTSLSAEVFTQLAHDPQLMVRSYLAENVSITLPAQRILSADAKLVVVHRLSRNPSLVLGPHLPVWILKDTEPGRSYLESRLAAYDPSARRALNDWEGTLTELETVLTSFSPEPLEP